MEGIAVYFSFGHLNFKAVCLLFFMTMGKVPLETVMPSCSIWVIFWIYKTWLEPQPRWYRHNIETNKQTKKGGQGPAHRREISWKDNLQPATSICIHATAPLHWLPTWHPCRCTDSRGTMQHRTHICCQEAWNPCLVSCPMFARWRINEAESWHQRVATIRISEHHFHSVEPELSLCSVFASVRCT